MKILKPTNGIVKCILLLFFTIIYSANIIAQEDDIFDMSFEDQLNMNVTTVSKSAEKLSDAPGIISVITKEEIKYPICSC